MYNNSFVMALRDHWIIHYWLRTYHFIFILLFVFFLFLRKERYAPGNTGTLKRFSVKQVVNKESLFILVIYNLSYFWRGIQQQRASSSAPFCRSSAFFSVSYKVFENFLKKLGNISNAMKAEKDKFLDFSTLLLLTFFFLIISTM